MNSGRQTWVGLIRGIGGATHAKMPMAALREGCIAAGLQDVSTVLATGNVLFSSDWQEARIQEVLEGVIAAHGLSNAVILRRPEELAAVMAHDPMPEAAEKRASHLLVMFLRHPLGPGVAAALRDHGGPERIVPGKRELYIDYVDGVGRSRLTGAWLERRLGQPGTARNWNTLARLLVAARIPGAG